MARITRMWFWLVSYNFLHRRFYNLGQRDNSREARSTSISHLMLWRVRDFYSCIGPKREPLSYSDPESCVAQRCVQYRRSVTSYTTKLVSKTLRLLLSLILTK